MKNRSYEGPIFSFLSFGKHLDIVFSVEKDIQYSN